MILDTSLNFSVGIAITTSKVSTVLDGKTLRDFGRGAPIYLNIYLDTAFTSTTANELTIAIVSSSGADPAVTDHPISVLQRSSDHLQSTGCIFRGAWPVGVQYERVALAYIATTALAAGYISAYLTLGGDVSAVVLT